VILWRPSVQQHYSPQGQLRRRLIVLRTWQQLFQAHELMIEGSPAHLDSSTAFKIAMMFCELALNGEVQRVDSLPRKVARLALTRSMPLFLRLRSSLSTYGWIRDGEPMLAEMSPLLCGCG